MELLENLRINEAKKLTVSQKQFVKGLNNAVLEAEEH